MRKKIFVYSLLPSLAIVGVLGASLASAHGWGPFGPNATPEQIANAQITRFQSVVSQNYQKKTVSMQAGRLLAILKICRKGF